MTTLEKVKSLEQYIAVGNASNDPVIELVINKIMTRETERMRELQARLETELNHFEKNYALTSEDFYRRYEKGEMGDAMDLVEWSATCEMLANTKKRLALLEADSIS